MHIVAALSWQKDEAEIAGIIAGILGILVYEARQRIAGGGPAVLACLADPRQATVLAERLSRAGVPTLVIDRDEVRNQRQPFRVCRFKLEARALWIESLDGESCTIAYDSIELLLVATCNVQGQSTATVTERKFSLGKTLLAGGVPMSKKVTREVTVSSNERDETLWLYARSRGPVIFDRSALNYEGLGSALQLSRDLNFVYLRKELRRLAPQAGYDERLLNRAGLIRLLGSILSPEADLDLAFEILAHALRKHPEETVVSGKIVQQ
jgi:hypothetical protein